MKTTTKEQNLKRIKSDWKFFLKIFKENPSQLWDTNMQHRMSGSMQNCYDLCWLIIALDKEYNKNEKTV